MPEHEKAYHCIDAYVGRRRREASNPALSIALTDRERTVHLAGYGVAELGTGDPVTPDTLFEIGSVSKTFGAVVTLQA